MKREGKEEHQSLCTEGMLSGGHGEEVKGGQEIRGKHLLKHEHLSDLGLIWVGKAEPASRDGKKSGWRHRNVRISLLWVFNAKLEICICWEWSWCGAGMSWGAATSQDLLLRVNPFGDRKSVV